MRVMPPRRPAPPSDDVYDFVPLPECARRMQISEGELRRLVKSRAVACYGSGIGLMVQPTLLI